jgi:hypothetical protein
LVTKDEMIGLVRAIKFANPDASIRQVHREITEVLSRKDHYDFLANISLNDVKKVWKKAVMMSSTQQQQQNQQQTLQNQQSSTTPQTNGAMEEPILRFYTIGNGSIPFLAQEYSQAKAREAAVAAAKDSAPEKEGDKNLQHNSSNMFSVFLDVPADRSGQRPYQAIVNFQENNRTTVTKTTTNTTTTTSSVSHNMPTNQKRKDAARKNKTKNTVTDKQLQHQDDIPIICKIQVAATSSPQDGTKFPMLLYNQDRTIKTFIHPDSEQDDDDDGYNRIHTMVTCHGVGGALGVSGGSKAYFYTYLVANDILNIDTSRLADVPTTW